MTCRADDKFEGEKKENRNDFMDNNDLLKVYIEKVDRDQSDLRADIKESERRTTEQINRVESRMDERLNRIETLLLDTQERVSQTTKVIDAKLETFRSDIKEHKFFRITSSIGIITVCLATIIGIAAVAVTMADMLGN